MTTETFISNSIPAIPNTDAYMDRCATYDPIAKRIYIIGGWTGTWSEGYVMQTVQIYDIQYGTWLDSNYAAKLPIGLGGGSCEYFNGNIYYFGGYTYPYNRYNKAAYTPVNTVYKYLIATNSWNSNSIATLSAARSRGRTIITDTALILYVSGDEINSVDIFDPTTDTIVGTASVNHARRGFIIGKYNHKIFVFAGQSAMYIEYGIYDDYTSERSTAITDAPTLYPTLPTTNPTSNTQSPTRLTNDPSKSPTEYPTISPSENPTNKPTYSPTIEPTANPTLEPTLCPTDVPTTNTINPTKEPSTNPSDINSETTETVSKSDMNTVDDINSKLGDILAVIIIFLILSVIMGILCLVYLLKKQNLSQRTNEVGTATFIDTLKELEISERLGLILEIVDIITDYMYSSQLILAEITRIKVLGWFLLMFSICGVLLFLFKVNLMKKLIGKQCKEYKQQREMNRITSTQLNDEVKRRFLDIGLFSFVCSCFEDLPQCVISISVSTSQFGWTSLSILSFSLSLISFLYKLVKIVSIKIFGMFDLVDPKKASFVEDANDQTVEMQTDTNQNEGRVIAT
eukprot:55847_1